MSETHRRDVLTAVVPQLRAALEAPDVSNEQLQYNMIVTAQENTVLDTGTLQRRTSPPTKAGVPTPEIKFISGWCGSGRDR